MPNPTLRHAWSISALLTLLALPSLALAQDEGTSDSAPQAPQQSPSSSSTTIYQGLGLPSPGTDLEAHLPSGSKATTDTSTSTDGFDLNKPENAAGSVKGGKDSQYIVGASGVPRDHTVRRGDTLWSISGEYFGTPYKWPQVWATNAQIQNPHWIYPGDRVRLRSDDELSRSTSRRALAPSSVLLRDMGWVDDPDKDTLGELVGSPEDNVLLAEGDPVYVQLDDDVKISVGDELTIFVPLRTMRGEEADAEGELVAVRGTLRVDKWNPKTHIARGMVTEALDTIERGALVGAVKRKFAIVPPVRNEKYVEARILTALYPHQIFSQNQVVFLDRGAKEGVRPGNRFLAVKRGDRWVDSIASRGQLMDKRAMSEDDADAVIGDLKSDGPADDYPDELYAEVRVLTVRNHTSMAIVTEAAYELERDAVLVMKKGF